MAQTENTRTSPINPFLPFSFKPLRSAPMPNRSRIQTVRYRNYRGEVSTRHIIPLGVWFGVSEFHASEGEQWFVKAYDIDKEDNRDFALKDFLGAP